MALVDRVKPPADLTRLFLHQALAVVLSRVQDPDRRMGHENHAFLAWAMEKGPAARHEVQQFVLNSAVSPFEHQLIKIKLRLLDSLIANGAVKLGEAMQVVLAALAWRKKEIRAAALALFCLLARTNGRQARLFLAKVPAQLRAAVQEDLGWTDPKADRE
jgi:hypothetical protein